MTQADEPGSIFGMDEARREAEDEARALRQNMPFPPLGGRGHRGHMIHSTNYGQGVPEISQQYQEAINTPQNQLLEEVMRSLAMSDGTVDVAPNELDASPMTMDMADALHARTAAISHDKRRRMGYPMTDEFGGTIAKNYYPPNPPKSRMP